MAKDKDLNYRVIYRKVDGSYLALNFFATNRPLALDHAYHMASDSAIVRAYGPLTVTRVTKYSHCDAEAGVFYRAVWIGELRGWYRAPEAK